MVDSFHGGLNGDGFFGEEYEDEAMSEETGYSRSSKSSNFTSDPYYYFYWKSYKSVVRETEKAYLFDLGKYQMWIPKKLVAKQTDKRILVHESVKKFERIKKMDNPSSGLNFVKKGTSK